MVKKAKDFFGEGFEGRRLDVVDRMFMQYFPHPFDDRQISTVGWQKVQAAARLCASRMQDIE